MSGEENVRSIRSSLPSVASDAIKLNSGDRRRLLPRRQEFPETFEVFRLSPEEVEHSAPNASLAEEAADTTHAGPVFDHEPPLLVWPFSATPEVWICFHRQVATESYGDVYLSLFANQSIRVRRRTTDSRNPTYKPTQKPHPYPVPP